MALVWCWAGPSLAQTQQGTDTRRIERVKAGAEGKTGVGDRWALIVGVDKYESKDIDPLAGAVADAKAIRDVLVKYADFPPSQVRLLVSDGPEKPTRTDIMIKLDEIKSSTKPGDLLLFFFAGHGVQVDGQRYLLTYDTRINSPAVVKSTSLPASNLMQEIESIKVAHRVIMIDACRNDPTKPGKQPTVADEAFEAAFTLMPASEGGVRATFLASSKGQSAYEWTEKRRGFFSYFIERGLTGEAAQFGKVTVTSLLTYLNEMVPQAVREQKNQLQVPYAKVDGSELVLVKGDKLTSAAPGLDKPAPATRTIYGVVKDSGGLPLTGATITVALAGTSRATTKVDPATLKVTTDEDGFFKIEGVPPDVDARVVAAKDSYQSKTLTTTAAEAGKKMVVFLPKVEVAPAMVASHAAVPAGPAKGSTVAAGTPAVAPVPPPAAPGPPVAPTAPASRPAPPVVATPAAASLPSPPAPSPSPRAAPTVRAQPPAPTPAPPRVEVAQVQPPPPAASQPPPPRAASVPSTPPPVMPSSADLALAKASELALISYRTFLAEDFKEAESSAREALQSEADNALANAVVGNTLAVMGINNFDSQKLAAARPFIDRALKRDANLAIAHNALGLTLMAEGKMDEALVELQKAIKSNGILAVAHANLGYVYVQKNRLADAERSYREAIRIEPENAVPYNGLSNVLFSMGKYKDAAKACREAISRYQLRDRFLGLFYVQLAIAQFQQGRQEEALEAVGRAKALGLSEHDAYTTIEKGKPAKKKG